MLYMLTAGKKALADGRITEEVMNELDKTKCGVLIGSAMGGMKVTLFYRWFQYNIPLSGIEHYLKYCNISFIYYLITDLH